MECTAATTKIICRRFPENATFSFYTREIISISTVPEWVSYGKFYPAGYVKTGRVFYCPLNDGKNVMGDYYGNAGAWSWINFLNNGGKPETVKSNVAGGYLFRSLNAFKSTTNPADDKMASAPDICRHCFKRRQQGSGT